MTNTDTGVWTDDGKKVAQMKENAGKEIERLLYERIVAQPTLVLCQYYLNQYPNGIHKQQVMVKMEPCLFDEAIRTNTLYTYFDYLEEYPDGYRDLEIKKQLDTLVFKTLDEEEDFSSFERYLRLSPKTKDALLTRMEPLMFEWAKRVNTVESYDQYLSLYPGGAHLREVQAGMDPLLFKKAQDEDWYSAYEEYIKKCPDGANVEKARQRFDWLKSQKAVPEISFPMFSRNRVGTGVSTPSFGRKVGAPVSRYRAVDTSSMQKEEYGASTMAAAASAEALSR